MQNFELPRPADWSGDWRVVYAPNGLTSVHVDAQQHSGNGDDTAPVTEHRSARFVSYRGQDMTFLGNFSRGLDGEWTDGIHNMSPRRRDSVKFDDPAPRTYAAAFLAALRTALEAEWQTHPERWQHAEGSRLASERERLVRARDEAATVLRDAQDALDRFDVVNTP